MRHEMDAGWTGSIWLDDLDWDGQPRNFTTTSRKPKPNIGAISQWTYLRGYWRLQDGAYHGSGPGINETYSGDIAWKDTTLTVSLTPLLGSQHLISVRVQGALRSYAFGLAPNGTVTLYKNAGGYHVLASAPYEWKPGQSYTLRLDCKGNRITGEVDGVPPGRMG